MRMIAIVLCVAATLATHRNPDPSLTPSPSPTSTGAEPVKYEYEWLAWRSVSAYLLRAT